MINAVIVDDEAPARREMRRLLSLHHTITVVGDADRLATARGLLERVHPDVVFLDIRLGRESGFDLLDAVDPQCDVVFVTAYDSHAVQAFEARALDYLLKPVEPARLATTIARIAGRASRLQTPHPAAPSPSPFSRSRWVFLDDGQHPDFVEVVGVTHVVSEDGGTRVHGRDGRSRHSAKTLVEWEHRVPADDFKRVHRGALVNLRHVTRVERWSNYSYRLFLAGWAEPVTMSRRFALALKIDLS